MRLKLEKTSLASVNYDECVQDIVDRLMSFIREEKSLEDALTQIKA